MVLKIFLNEILFVGYLIKLVIFQFLTILQKMKNSKK